MTARYVFREARGGAVDAALRLREKVFGRSDGDDLDRLSRHFVLVDTSRQEVVGALRLRLHADGAAAAHGYSGRHHDVSSWRDLPGPMVEIGRLAVAPGHRGPSATAALWGGLAREIERSDARLVFGCASLTGADPARHAEILARLARHPAPAHLAPGGRQGAVAFDGRSPATPAVQLPPLIRFYLSLGGWAGRHAVPDRGLDTLHVLMGLEPDRVPARRARRLLALAPPD